VIIKIQKVMISLNKCERRCCSFCVHRELHLVAVFGTAPKNLTGASIFGTQLGKKYGSDYFSAIAFQ